MEQISNDPPVVNTESDELTKFLTTLSPAQRQEAVRWSDLPDAELKKPNQRQAAAYLKKFVEAHMSVPNGERNDALFLYSCRLRRCGLSENAILDSLWNFSAEHCIPPHNPANSNDVTEFKGLAARAFKYVRVGFPKNNPAEPDNQRTERPYIIDNDRLYLSCVDAKFDYWFVHTESGKLVFDQSFKGFYPRRMQEKDGQPVAIVGLPSREALEAAIPVTAPILFDRIDAHLKKYLDAPDLDRQLFTYYVIYSWFYLKTNTAPYLRFLADTGNGKSRMQRVTGDLCFYPIKAGGSSTPSGIMRIKEKWNGTLLIDEADLRESTTTNELVKYLNLGFEKGQYFIKTDKDNPKEQDIFDPFCPKVIAMRHPFQDNATEGRLLSFTPKETSRKDIPIILPASYADEVDELRATIARFVMLNWQLVDGEKTLNLQDMDIEPRLKQLAIPLSIVLQLFPDGERRLKEYLTERQKEIKRTRASSLEGMTFNGVLDWVQDQPDEKGHLTATDVKDRCGLRSNTAATKILHGIGFKTELIREGKRIRVLVVPDRNTWNSITQRYYFSDNGEKPSCPQQLRGACFGTLGTLGTLTIHGLSPANINNNSGLNMHPCTVTVPSVPSDPEPDPGVI
jgi:hypothetical protein